LYESIVLKHAKDDKSYGVASKLLVCIVS